MELTDNCMFCGDTLPQGPENLAFLEHVHVRQDCDDRYESWMAYMHQDYIGY